MNSLRVLTREPRTMDEEIPLNMALRTRDEHSMACPDAETNRFLGMQRLVCAPLLAMGIHTQAANFWSSLPIVEVRNASGREDKEREVYEARVHGEYLRT